MPTGQCGHCSSTLHYTTASACTRVPEVLGWVPRASKTTHVENVNSALEPAPPRLLGETRNHPKNEMGFFFCNDTKMPIKETNSSIMSSNQYVGAGGAARINKCSVFEITSKNQMR